MSASFLPDIFVINYVLKSMGLKKSILSLEIITDRQMM